MSCRDTSKTKTNYKMGVDYSSICYIGPRIGWVSALFIIILPYYQPPSKLHIVKAGDKVLLSDNYKVNLTTR